MKKNTRIEHVIERKVYRKRSKWANWKKDKNRKDNSRKKASSNLKATNPYRRKNKTIRVPEVFSLIVNIEGVLKFAAECKKYSGREYAAIHFDFSDVKEISHSAMALFLSVANDLERWQISVSCNFPTDQEIRSAFIGCGIMEFVRTAAPFPKSDNSILVSGLERIDQQRTAPQVAKAMKTVFGHSTRNQKMQGMIVEMMTNSVNHAFLPNKKNTNWYLSVFHDEVNKRTKFCFIDNGPGILNTIRRKTKQTVKEIFNPKQMLIDAFDGEYGSRTLQSERGTGLVMIRDCFRHNIISNLKVITNNQFYDFHNEKVQEISNSFDGTFYFWELDTNCKNVTY